MYNLQKNNYHLKPKPSNIKKNKIKNFVFQTPLTVSQFIYELLRDKFNPGLRNQITDPCSGEGNLLKPWKEAGFNTYGNDIDIKYLKQGLSQGATDFLKQKPFPVLPPQLVLCNPPFNGYKGKSAAEVWLDKIIELFGKDTPIVLFVPYNFRLPWKSDSKRLSKFLSGEYPPIASIISLPTKGLWEGVIFHSEILIFNIPNLQPHYFFKAHDQN